MQINVKVYLTEIILHIRTPYIFQCYIYVLVHFLSVYVQPILSQILSLSRRDDIRIFTVCPSSTHVPSFSLFLSFSSLSLFLSISVLPELCRREIYFRPSHETAIANSVRLYYA